MTSLDLDYTKDLVAKRYFTSLPAQLARALYCPLQPHPIDIKLQGPLPCLSQVLTSPAESPLLEASDGELNPTPRRRRVSVRQKEILSRVFCQSFFPTTEMRNQLAMDLNMTPRAVQIWFQNKRQAWRTKNKASL
ncbi:Short stature homeobox protein 2, partial [Massospora cicadina]